MAWYHYLELAWAFLPFVALAAAIVFVGWLAYDARVARQTRGAPALYDREAPLRELSRLNALLAAEARAARATLAQTRDTLQRGIKG